MLYAAQQDFCLRNDSMAAHPQHECLVDVLHLYGHVSAESMMHLHKTKIITLAGQAGHLGLEFCYRVANP